MKPDESPVDEPRPEEDSPSKGGDWSPDEDFGIPLPDPCDSDPGGYAVEIFGDERGGQTPKLPPRRKGDQDE